MDYDLPPEIKSLIEQCEANVISFDNNQMSEALYFAECTFHQLNELENAIREHRDSWLRGDDKCWKDNEALYRLLPEGYTAPPRDTTVELHLCEKYIKSCHAPHIEYVSPQRRIEELEEEVRKLYIKVDMLKGGWVEIEDHPGGYTLGEELYKKWMIALTGYQIDTKTLELIAEAYEKGDYQTTEEYLKELKNKAK